MLYKDKALINIIIDYVLSIMLFIIDNHSMEYYNIIIYYYTIIVL